MLGRRSRDGQPRSTSGRGVAVVEPSHARWFALEFAETTIRSASAAADAAMVAARAADEVARGAELIASSAEKTRRAADETAEQAAMTAQSLRATALVAADAAARARAAAIAQRTSAVEASGALAPAQTHTVTCRKGAQPRAGVADESSRSVRHIRPTGSLSRVTRSKRTPWDELETVRRGVRAAVVHAGGRAPHTGDPARTSGTTASESRQRVR